MDRRWSPQHNPYMANQPKLGRYFKEWRGELTLEAAAERIAEIATEWGLDTASKKIPTTHASLSRIESGKSGYSEITLELLAEAYNTHPIALLTRKPDEAPTLWETYKRLTGDQRKQLDGFAEVMVTKTA